MLKVEDLRIDDMKDEIISNMNNVLDTQQRLFQELDRIHRKELDINHKIELSENLNVTMGFDLYKMLRENLRERRVVKNKIEEIEILVGLVKQTAFYKDKPKVERFSKCIDRAVQKNTTNNSKVYYVREMKTEFGQTITSANRDRKASMKKTSKDVRVNI